MAVTDPEGRETRTLHSLVDFRGKEVLEIGSGDGRMTFRFAEPTARVLALDPVEERVRLARERMPKELGGKIRFMQADATSFRYPASSFDIAILSHSL